MDAANLDLSMLARDLIQAGSDAPRKTDQLLETTGAAILADMQAGTPVRTGRLRASEAMTSSPGRVVIGPVDVDYASFVEFGTGTRGEFPTSGWTIRATPGKTLAFVIDGKTVFARSVQMPGARPHPYVRPAAQKYLESLGAQAARVGVEMIVNPKLAGAA